MRIGELSVKAGVPTKTIRYYEEVGLMPAPARTPSRYRDYDGKAEHRLGFIRAAQSVGLTLGEIREVLALRDRGQNPCSHVAHLIQQHAEGLSDRIAALEAMRRELERLAKRAKAGHQHEAAFCHIIEG